MIFKIRRDEDSDLAQLPARLGLFTHETKPMPIPDLSAEQLLLLSALIDGEQSGPYLRNLLQGATGARYPYGFYPLIKTMELDSLVYSRDETPAPDCPGVVPFRWYKITQLGINIWEEARFFYASILRLQDGLPSEGGK